MTHVAVIGGGIVGLSCAWAAQRRGFEVTLVDRDFWGDRASHGNAGGLAVTECIPLRLSGLGLKPLKWLIDPLGPLSVRLSHAPRMLPWFLALRKVADQARFRAIARALASINDRCLADFESVMDDIGLSSHIHKRGALTVYETVKALAADAGEWAHKRELGVRWRSVDRGELRELEPGLADVFAGGVMLDDWAHINDPKAVVDALRRHLVQSGVKTVQGEVSALETQPTFGVAMTLSSGNQLVADRVVVAAGAWSARLCKSLGERAVMESERGYNTTLPFSANRLNREVIFAERKFVATPLSVGLRIGGAAEFAGLEAPANYERSEALLKLARRFLPNLDESNAKQWMGNRPTTPDSLPVIGQSKVSPSVLYAFGHGHLGLTQSATTGELIGQLLRGERPSIDLEPFSIGRFAHPPLERFDEARHPLL